MEREKQVQDPKDKVCKWVFGVKLETFEQMLVMLLKAYDKQHKRGGSPPKLTVEDKWYITLNYLREYRTQGYSGRI
jgi:hypothetical protein